MKNTLRGMQAKNGLSVRGGRLLFIVVSSSILIAGLVCAAIAYFSFVQPSQKYAEAMDAFDSDGMTRLKPLFPTWGTIKTARKNYVMSIRQIRRLRVG